MCQLPVQPRKQKYATSFSSADILQMSLAILPMLLFLVDSSADKINYVFLDGLIGSPNHKLCIVVSLAFG